MATPVRACPKCGKLMWIKEAQIKVLDENTVSMTCPHCQQTVRFKSVTAGENAAGPQMGH